MLKFGVEIEVANLDINKAEDLLRQHNIGKNYTQTWKAVMDGSINPYGSEFVSPIFTWEEKDAIFEVIDLIKTTKGTCNQSCGLHIHMSGDFPKSWDSMKETIWKWYLSIQPGFIPAKRRKSSYCKEKLGKDKHQIVTPVRECAWNIESPHIELRLFNAHLCKRWFYRCLKTSRELGIILEGLKSAVGQPALIGI
jgi:hypothetical protein